MTFDSRWRLFADPAAIPPVSSGLDVHQQQAMIQAAFKPVERFAHDYLFLAGYALINLIGCALIAAAYFQGWVGMITAAGLTDSCLAITAVFLVGLLVATLQALSLSRDLAAAYTRVPPPHSRAGEYLALIRGRGGESHTVLGMALRSKQSVRASFVRYFAQTILAVGVIGTLAAFILVAAGLANMSPEPQGQAAALMHAVVADARALHPALLGLVFHVWLMANHQLLKSGAMHLVDLIIERGEIEFAE